MANRVVTQIETETSTFLMEGVDVIIPNTSRDFTEGENTTRRGEYTSAKRVDSAVKHLRNTIESVGEMLHSSIDVLSPNEYEAEFSIATDIKTGLPFIASSELGAGIKIKLKWKSNNSEEKE